MKNIYRILLVVTSMLVLAFFPLANNIQPVHGLGNGCASSSPASGAYTVTVCITNPVDGDNLVGDASVTATVNVTGPNPLVQRMVFYLDGVYLLTDFQNTYTFTLPTTKWVDGSYTISASALMRDGFTTGQASVLVKFRNNIITPPVNTNQFTPSTGSPPAAGAPFIVAAGGDGAAGDLNSQSVTDLVLVQNPNLFLYLGDVYEKGSTAEFYNWYGTGSTFFSRLRPITDPTIGNHEYVSGSPPAYFDYWDNIPNYYSFNAGGWHFISLNSNASNIPVTPNSAQYNWLQQDLAANPGTCTIVFYHQPLFNIGPEGSTVAMADIWKLMAQYGVDIVLNGHDHDYQRWVPLDGNGNPSLNGITEFVVGSAGHGLQTISRSDNRVAYSNSSNPAAFGALLLQLNPNSANFSYMSINGTTLDSGVIPCIDPAPMPGADVVVGGAAQGSVSLAPVPFTTLSLPGLSNGPAQVASTDGAAIIPSERMIYSVNGGSPVSYSELIGFPANKLTTEYWIPWYNNVNMWTQLRFGNPSTSLSTTVQVYLGTTLLDTIPLGPNQSARKDYPNVNGGPVHILSTNSSAPVIAAERVIYPEGNGMVNRGVDTSYFELMAIPGNQLTTEYWIPWYNNVNFWTQLRFANVSPTLSTTVEVYLGTTLLGSYPLGPASSTRQDFPGLDGGPLRIVSTNSSVPIIAAERVIYDVGGTQNRGTDASYSEMAAIPGNQLTSEYWFPSYSYPDANTWSQVRVANPSATTTATIDVYLGTTLLEEFSLPASTGIRKDYLGQDGGPLRIVSTTGLPILASERVILTVAGVQTSYAEVTGYPGNQLTDTYLFPWYNDLNFDTQLRIGAP